MCAILMRPRSAGGPTLVVGGGTAAGPSPPVPHTREPPVWVDTKVPASAPGASFATVGNATVRKHCESSARPQSSEARSHANPFSSPAAGPDAHDPPIAFGVAA